MPGTRAKCKMLVVRTGLRCIIAPPVALLTSELGKLERKKFARFFVSPDHEDFRGKKAVVIFFDH